MPFSAIHGTISVFCLSASGRTGLAAFHNALCGADLDGYNLVHLSSVIPPGTAVDASGAGVVLADRRGDRMYCVYAQRRAEEPGDQAWAGLGWVQSRDGTGGLFVEHDGRDKDIVEALIQASLSDIVQGAADRYTAPEWALQGVTCTDEPVCALVIAPYESARWMGVACD